VSHPCRERQGWPCDTTSLIRFLCFAVLLFCVFVVCLFFFTGLVIFVLSLVIYAYLSHVACASSSVRPCTGATGMTSRLTSRRSSSARRIHTNTYTYIHIHNIYIYIERERERERVLQRPPHPQRHEPAAADAAGWRRRACDGEATVGEELKLTDEVMK